VGQAVGFGAAHTRHLAFVQLGQRLQEGRQHGDHLFVSRVGGLGLLAALDEVCDTLDTTLVGAMALADVGHQGRVF
jgi:hypothetical protein